MVFIDLAAIPQTSVMKGNTAQVMKLNNKVVNTSFSIVATVLFFMKIPCSKVNQKKGLKQAKTVEIYQ